jgi:hypothetical protein
MFIQFNIKFTKSSKNNYFIVVKVSYKKLQHVSADISSSGEDNIKYVKDSMIKLRVFYINFA